MSAGEERHKAVWDPLEATESDDEDFHALSPEEKLDYRCRQGWKKTLVKIFQEATDCYRVLRYAWEYGLARALDPIAPNSICHFQRHLLAKAKHGKRLALQSRQQWRSVPMPAGLTTGLISSLNKPIEVARVAMCTAEVTFWVDRAPALGPILFGSAQHSRDGVSWARRAERQAKEDLMDANRAMLQVGGSEADVPFQYTDVAWYVRMNEGIKYEVATWLSEQEKASKVRVARLVTRAIVNVKRRLKDEDAVDAYRASVARIVASRSPTPTPSLASASPPPSPSLPPSPSPTEAAAAQAARERAAALAAVRKANLESYQKFARVEAERQREAKEREAKERYAGKSKRAADARAREAKEREAKAERAEAANRAYLAQLFGPQGIEGYRRERELREQREREAEAEAERQRLARLEHERATARLAEAAKRLKAEKAAAAARAPALA